MADNNAMSDEQLQTTLRSVGKRFFRKVYDRAVANGGELSEQDVDECNPGANYAHNSMNTKRSGVRRIFRSGRQREALQICREVRGWG